MPVTDQHGQTPEGSGTGNIGVQAIPYAHDVGGANAPGVSDELQTRRLWLPHDDGLHPG